MALGSAVLAAGCNSTADKPTAAGEVIERTEADCSYSPDFPVVAQLLRRGRSPDALARDICRAIGQVPPEQAAAAARSLTIVVNGTRIPGRMTN